jgi:hypothetical protein
MDVSFVSKIKLVLVSVCSVYLFNLVIRLLIQSVS